MKKQRGNAAAIERVQAHSYDFELLSIEAGITTATADKLLEMMALFPLMQYDKGSSEEQPLRLIKKHFKGDMKYRMPNTVE